jgi:hypothetical protein
VQSLNPADFGGDPTGRVDSTAAFAALCARLFNASGRAGNRMASHITNFGGATLDLAGGEFLISAPLVVPVLVGNVRITGGTLRASQTFPADRFLIEVGSADCVPADAQGVCNEYVVVHDIMLDAAHVAAGGVVVYHTMGATVGPNAFLAGFNQAGVLVEGGHETIVSDSWMAEYYWSDGAARANASSACQSGTTNGSVGVIFNGEDNYMSNVIVFDFTCTGVIVNGAATTLDGVHCWNGGGVAISLQGSYDIQDRIINCYLDYSQLVITEPKFVLAQGNFFYNAHTVLAGDALHGLVMRENVYSLNDYGGDESIVLQPSSSGSGGGGLPTCSKVVVEDDIDAEQSTAPHHIRATSARQSLYQQNATDWAFNFSATLLLPRIDDVAYSLVLDEGQPLVLHAARAPQGRVVHVNTASPVSGTVTMSVSQCGE